MVAAVEDSAEKPCAGFTSVSNSCAAPGTTAWFSALGGGAGRRPGGAVAGVLEGQSATGGSTAAPIARVVMEALLRPAANP